MSFSRVRIITIGLLVACGSHAESHSGSITLESLVARALSRSDQIVAQKARIEEKQELAIQAGAWQNPSLEFGVGAKFASPVVGPLFKVGLSQLFFFPGKQRLRKEVLEFEKTLEEIGLNEFELAITVDVTRLAYEYVINSRKAVFAQNRRKRFELIEAYLSGHTFASPQQKTTSLIVKERLKNIGVDQERLHGVLEGTLEQLNFYVAQDHEKIPEIAVPWLLGNRTLDKKLWLERALAGNVELASQRTLLNQATKEKELFSQEVWPDLSVSPFYSQETAGETERTVGIGFSLPLPILNLNRAVTKSKEHKIKAEQYQLSLKQRKIDSLVQKLLAEYGAIQKIVAEYPQNSIATLESQLRSMETEFRRNRLDFLLFLELDIQAAETVNRVLDAQLSFIDTIASLHFLARDRNLISDLSSF